METRYNGDFYSYILYFIVRSDNVHIIVVIRRFKSQIFKLK